MNGHLLGKLDGMTALTNRLNDWIKLVAVFQDVVAGFEHFRLEFRTYRDPKDSALLTEQAHWISLDLSWDRYWKNECRKLRTVIGQVSAVRSPHPLRPAVGGLDTAAMINELTKGHTDIRAVVQKKSVGDLSTQCDTFDDTVKIRLQDVLTGIDIESQDLIQMVKDVRALLAPPDAPAVVNAQPAPGAPVAGGS